MKSTYKILSVHLDGKPLAKDIQIKVWSPSDDNLFYIDAERNLLDYPHCRRVVLGSKLLADALETISQQVYQLPSIEELVVKIDYCSPIAVTNRLFLKRVLQAIGQLKQWHPDIIYVIKVEEYEFDRIKALYEQIQSST